MVSQEMDMSLKEDNTHIKAKRVADGQHGLAHPDAVGGAQRDGAQQARRRGDVDHRQVFGPVCAYQVSHILVALPVGAQQRHPGDGRNLALHGLPVAARQDWAGSCGFAEASGREDGAQDVVVGHYVALLVPHNPCAVALRHVHLCARALLVNPGVSHLTKSF